AIRRCRMPAFAMLLVFVILGIALWRLRSRFPGAQVHDAQGRGIDGASLSDAGRLGALVVVPILLVILLASSIRVVPVGHALVVFNTITRQFRLAEQGVT